MLQAPRAGRRRDRVGTQLSGRDAPYTILPLVSALNRPLRCMPRPMSGSCRLEVHRYSVTLNLCKGRHFHPSSFRTRADRLRRRAVWRNGRVQGISVS